MWGIFTWRGKPQKKERQIHGPLKREWSLYELDPNAPKLVEQVPSAAHYEEPRAMLNAVYGVARTKHIVPRCTACPSLYLENFPSVFCLIRFQRAMVR